MHGVFIHLTPGDGDRTHAVTAFMSGQLAGKRRHP